MKIQSIVKNNDKIYLALVKRKKELKITNRQIALDALKHDVSLPLQSLSKYFNRKPEANLKEHAILWLCKKFCINVELVVEPEEYSEFKSELNISL